jgi:protoporphyrinogen oxidase
VTALDHAPHVGGLAGSITIDGQSVDFGSHRLHPSIDDDLLADLQQLDIGLQWRPRRGRIRLQGRWLDFPLRAADLVRHAPKRFAGRVVADSAAAPVRRRMAQRRSGPAESFADAVRRGLGSAIADAFYEPYARKLWARRGDELSAELFRRRVPSGSTGAIIRKVLAGHDRPGFWYPERGFGSICTTLAAGIEAAAGVVATDSRVRSIESVDDEVRVTLHDGRSVLTRSLIATIPSTSLLSMLDAPTEVRAAAGELEFRGAVLVYLTVPRPVYTPFDAHYFPEPSTIVSRLSEPKRYRTSPLDPVDRTVICAEIPATPGDEIWRRDDHALARQVADELSRLGLPDPGAASMRVERRTHVYPVYRMGHVNLQRVVDEYLDRLPNVVVVGRQATFAHDNTHHALLMGRTVAQTLRPDGRIDRRTWNDKRRVFADHVVED